jgi:hypothetical protein
MMSNPTVFETVPRLTQIAMAVKPEGMIADIVCPRIAVGSDKFIYSKISMDDFFTIPDTAIGRKSEANEVEFGASNITDSVNDYALDDFVPNRDIKAAADAGANFDPLAQATEGTSILLSMGREQRVATLSGTDQWSHASSTPITQMLAAFDAMLIRPNIGVMGRATWRYLRSHPETVAMALNRGGVSGGTAAKGILSIRQVADLLELDDIHIGEAFYNSAKKGQTASFAQLWGKHASFLRIDQNVTSVQGNAQPTFAFTAEWQQRFTGTRPDGGRGIHGGQSVRVGEQLKELISWQQAGYHFHNAVA